MPAQKVNVVLISYTKDALDTVVSAIRQCYSKIGAKELKEKTKEETKLRLLKQVIESGHHSTIEHANFTFAIEGISRACSHQLVRHRIASYSQQSQRYVDYNKKGFDYIIPPNIENNPELKKEFEEMMDLIFEKYSKLIKEHNIPAEDARFLLPNATETKIVVTMNARSLLHFLEQRLCYRAQWEIRQVAELMHKELMKVAPEIFQYAGPTCITQRICWEGKLSCGRWKNIEGAELRSRFANIHND